MSIADWLSLLGLVFALVAFIMAARWNKVNEHSLTRLDKAISALHERNEELAASVASIDSTVSRLDDVRRLMARAAMASTPESFILLSLAEASDGAAFGLLCELGQSRRYSTTEMSNAARFLRDSGYVQYEQPLTPTTVLHLAS